MIISHEHKFIFLKTEKTGGSSVEAALSGVCGPADILTTLHDTERFRTSRGRQNDRRGLGRLMPVPSGLRRVAPDVTGFYPHIRASQARRMVPPQVWRSYFKFSVERNPWDRQVSLFFHRQRKRPRLTFEHWLGTPVGRALHYVRLQNWSIYAENSHIAVDHVIPYETLREGLAEVCAHLGLKDEVSLPWANSGFRPHREEYRALYSEANRERVSRWYQREIEAFAYAF